MSMNIFDMIIEVLACEETEKGKKRFLNELNNFILNLSGELNKKISFVLIEQLPEQEGKISFLTEKEANNYINADGRTIILLNYKSFLKNLK